MNKLLQKAFNFFDNIESKIAFYPTIIAILGFLLSLLMMYLEKQGISTYLVENFPVVVFGQGTTALTIFSALITGLISMMVFSFSMVMILLNQASSNFSPRLLPGLISNKKHQVILGIYLATIIYNIFISFSLHPELEKFEIPGFSVLLGIFLSLLCICAFIYFIHNISENIQISNILIQIFTTAKHRLVFLMENGPEENLPFPSTEGWHEYKVPSSGYLQNINYNNLITISAAIDTKIHVLKEKGAFVLDQDPLFKSEKELDEKTRKRILSNFNFAREELIGDNYALAFKQITEIIVKAMSPAVNDPGTAINGIDYLTELFALRIQKEDIFVLGNDKIAYVKFNTITFKQLIYGVMAPIRTYCKQDVILVKKLMMMFIHLKKNPAKRESFNEVIQEESDNLLKDAMEAIKNPRDLEHIYFLAHELECNKELLASLKTGITTI